MYKFLKFSSYEKDKFGTIICIVKRFFAYKNESCSFPGKSFEIVNFLTNSKWDLFRKYVNAIYHGKLIFSAGLDFGDNLS